MKYTVVYMQLILLLVVIVQKDSLSKKKDVLVRGEQYVIPLMLL